jgi:hypothetical protein
VWNSGSFSQDFPFICYFLQFEFIIYLEEFLWGFCVCVCVCVHVRVHTHTCVYVAQMLFNICWDFWVCSLLSIINFDRLSPFYLQCFICSHCISFIFLAFHLLCQEFRFAFLCVVLWMKLSLHMFHKCSISELYPQSPGCTDFTWSYIWFHSHPSFILIVFQFGKLLLT